MTETERLFYDKVFLVFNQAELHLRMKRSIPSSFVPFDSADREGGSKTRIKVFHNNISQVLKMLSFLEILIK